MYKDAIVETTAKLMFLLAVFFFAAPAAVAEENGWKLDRFMISAWGGPADEKTARAYAAAGFNTVMAKAEQLDLCARYGLRVIVMDATPEMAAQLKDHPGVWGWFVQDEPKEEEFAKVAERVAQFHAADPKHPAYVNLMAWMPLEKYLQTVKPRFLSYDYYQWWWNPRHYCGRLEVHRAAALKAGLPLFCWIEANADPRWEWGKPGATYLPDNLPKLRQSVSLALAYGVVGIQWFTGGLCFDKEGNIKPAGKDVALLNEELQALGPILLQLISEAVYHTAPVPPQTQPVPQDLWLQSPYHSLTFGLFRDAKRQRYVIVVNRDIQRERWIALHVEPGSAKRLEVFEVSRKRWQGLSLQPLRGHIQMARLHLLPGGLALLREAKTP